MRLRTKYLPFVANLTKELDQICGHLVWRVHHGVSRAFSGRLTSLKRPTARFTHVPKRGSV